MHNPKLSNIRMVLLPTVLLFPHVLILWWGRFPLLWQGERLGGPSCGPPSWLHSLSRAALLSCIILPFVAILLSVFFNSSKSTFPVGITSLLWGGGNWSKCGLLVHIHSMWRSYYYLPSCAVAAEVSVYSLASSSYLLPEQSFVQVLVHCTCVLSAYNALHSCEIYFNILMLETAKIIFYWGRCLYVAHD